MDKVLSVIMPAYNEAGHIHGILEKVCHVVLPFDFSMQLVVVNDGSNVTLVITVRVNVTGEIINVVNVTGDQDDNDTNNSKANETVVVNATSDLWVSKNVSNVNPAYGDVITYTIVVGNDGPDNATGVNLLVSPIVCLTVGSLNFGIDGLV